MAKKKKHKKPTPTPISPTPQPNTVGAALSAALKKMTQSLGEMRDKQEREQTKVADAITTEWTKSMGKPKLQVVPDPPVQIDVPSVPDTLAMPTDTVTRYDRVQWFWCGQTFTVIASYITIDSVATEDVVQGKLGSRKGDYTIDVIGYNGSALFHYPVSEAKVVAEYILSAIGWEHIWRQHYIHPGYTTEGGEMTYIPHDDPGPAVYDEPAVTEIIGDDPSNLAVHKCCRHCNQAQDTHAPHTLGCPSVDDPVVTEGGHVEHGPVTFSIPNAGVPPEGLASNECPDIRIHTGLPKDGIDDPVTPEDYSPTEFQGPIISMPPVDLDKPVVTVHEVGCSCGWKAELAPSVTLDEANRLMQGHSKIAHSEPATTTITWEE